jgi:hypothetical protein
MGQFYRMGQLLLRYDRYNTSVRQRISDSGEHLCINFKGHYASLVFANRRDILEANCLLAIRFTIQRP